MVERSGSLISCCCILSLYPSSQSISAKNTRHNSRMQYSLDISVMLEGIHSEAPGSSLFLYHDHHVTTAASGELYLEVIR